jgi:hypothetical protein
MGGVEGTTHKEIDSRKTTEQSRSLPISLSAVSEAPTSEYLSFRCALKGRFRYSDLKEAAPEDYGVCIWMSRS